jgi:lipoic acid synthetase
VGFAVQKTEKTQGKPSWLKVRAPSGSNYVRLHSLMRKNGLHTVCEEAHCPNIADCWNRGTATFLILGEICTRACSYCQITSGQPGPLDKDEPRRVGISVAQLALRHAVITSVNRDDVPDGGSSIFIETMRWIRRLSPKTTIELLIPDFDGNFDALAKLLAGEPDILNHNIETVPRLYKAVRHKAQFDRSLAILKQASQWSPRPVTKSGLMLGLGETHAEIEEVMLKLRAVDCDVLTLGQYLRPSPKHFPVQRYLTPEEFSTLGITAQAMGFKHVESGPLVRSSYHAETQVLNSKPLTNQIPIPLVNDGVGFGPPESHCC